MLLEQTLRYPTQRRTRTALRVLAPIVSTIALLTGISMFAGVAPRLISVGYGPMERLVWAAIGLGYLFVFIIGMCLNSFISNKGRHWDSLITLVVHAAMGWAAWFFFGWQGLVFAFFLPFLVTFALGSYLFYAQHNFEGMHLKPRDKWSYTDAAIESASYMKTGPVMAWLTGNIGYHHVHHLNPGIPFYRLPEAMAAIPELQAPGTTTWRLRDIAACLRLAVWSDSLQRMLTWRELRSLSAGA